MQQVQLFASSSAHLYTEVALLQQSSPGDCILHLLSLRHCNGSEYQTDGSGVMAGSLREDCILSLPLGQNRCTLDDGLHVDVNAYLSCKHKKIQCL